MLPESLRRRYEARALLGEGGFGRVVAARDRELGREVAIKVLSEAVHDADTRARFAREARLTAGLAHPHVVGVFDHGVAEDGSSWIAYELIEGQDLGRYWGAEAPPDSQLARLGAEVAEALAVAHAAGVLHRDLKPGNVMVREDGAAVLCDFGIARSDRAGTLATAEGVIMGTPAYMAPELFRGEPASPASDLFAWAATLLELRHGRGVYDAAALPEIMEAALAPAPLPRGFTPRDELDRVLVRALERDPAARTRDAAELARQLRGIEAGGGGDAAATPSKAGPSTAPTRPLARTRSAVGPVDRAAEVTTRAGTPPPRRRQRWPWVLAAALLLPVAAALLLHPAPFDPVVWGLLYRAHVEASSEAQVLLGERYRLGRGVPHDGVAARAWLARALAHPEPAPRAYRTRGMLDLEGAPGHPPEPEGALRWLQLAAQASSGRSGEDAADDWGALLEAARQLAPAEPEVVAALVEDVWRQGSTPFEPGRAAFLARAHLEPEGPIPDPVRGRVALWDVEGAPDPLPPSLGKLAETHGMGRWAIDAWSLEPRRLYLDPCRRGDPLACALLSRWFHEPDRRLRPSAHARSVGQALLERARRALGPEEGARTTLIEAWLQEEPRPLEGAKHQAGDPAWLDLPGEPPDLGPPERFQVDPGPEPEEASQHWSMAKVQLLGPGDLKNSATPGLQGTGGDGALLLERALHLERDPSVSPDLIRAVRATARYRLARAANQGYSLDLFHLAREARTRGDDEEYERLLIEAARRGSAVAQLEWARLLESDVEGFPASQLRSRRLARHAAGRAEGWAWLFLGKRLRGGRPEYPRDPVLAAVALDRCLRYWDSHPGQEAAKLLEAMLAQGQGFGVPPE